MNRKQSTSTPLFDESELNILQKIQSKIYARKNQEEIAYTRTALRKYLKDNGADDYLARLDHIDDENNQLSEYGVFAIRDHMELWYQPKGICNCGKNKIVYAQEKVIDKYAISLIMHLMGEAQASSPV